MKTSEIFIEERSSTGPAEDAKRLVEKAKKLSGKQPVDKEPVDPRKLIRREIAPGQEDALAVLLAEIEENTPITLAKAAEIMGVDFLGPEAVAKIFGTKLDVIPAIPFSKAELERAKQLGQYLHLEVDKLGNGKPLTMANLDETLSGRFANEDKGDILYDPKGWKEKEPFFTQDKPNVGWRLSTKNVLPGSTGKNDLEQTAMLAEYVTQVFNGQEMPQEYRDALNEFEQKKDAISRLLYENWNEAGMMLSELRLNKLCRRSPVSALAASNLYFDNTDARLMTNTYERTSRRSSLGPPVAIGQYDSSGATVFYLSPLDAGSDLGVVFSRSQ